MVGRISVLGSRELLATVYAIKSVDRELRKQVRQHTRNAIAPAWTREIQSQASTVMESRVIGKTARVSVSDQTITVRAAGSKRRALSGGLTPAEYGKAVEFGSDRNKKTTYTSRSRGGASFKVTRRTARQMRRFNRRGYVFYPAVAEMAPRALAMWVQTTVRTIAEALEGKS